ncbi:MAG: ZIP family metal transporter, partial [Gammaproteobacteria bacterium]
MNVASLGAAVALAIGMGLQNLPEGAAVALPLRRMGWPRMRCFWHGQLSAMVEPIAAVIGTVTVTACMPIMPYALAFAAGAIGQGQRPVSVAGDCCTTIGFLAGLQQAGLEPTL